MIKLLDFTNGNDHPFGNTQGRETFNQLLNYIDLHPELKVIELTLKGITATDASFPRESVISLAKHFKGEKWFILSDFCSPDLIDNWDYAAKAKQLPLVVRGESGLFSIGPELNSSAKELLEYVFKHQEVTTANVANTLNISVPNASTRLKKLVNEGLILRKEEVAPSGGIEYIYSSIK